MRGPLLRIFGLAWLFSLLAMNSSALAFGDCPLVGTLENFDAAQAPAAIAYDAVEFRVADGKDAKTIVKNGKVCKQHYDLKPGVARMSGLEIMQNYAEALPGEGMTITNANRANDDDVFATVTKGAAEYWIHVWESNGNSVHVLMLQVAPFQAKTVAAGAMDCPLVPVQQNFQTAQKPRLRTFDEEDFRVGEGDGERNVKKTGAVCKQDYDLKAGIANMSGLEIMQTYAEALPAAGMTITNAKRNGDDDVFATISKDGTTYWAHVWESNGNGLHILVLQDTPFLAHLAPPGADDCPVIPVEQNFQITSQRYSRNYDVQEFRVAEGDGDASVKKYGGVCQRDYDLKPGVANMSGLEIMRNYAEAAASTGYAIANAHRNPDDDVYASMTRDGASYWFHIWESNGNGLHILTLREAPFRSSLAALTAKDCPLAPALESFQTINPPRGKKFDAMDFPIVEGDQNAVVTKKGKVCQQDYDLKPGIATMSALEIMQNYAEWLPAEGLTITNTRRNPDDEVSATMTKDGVEFLGARLGKQRQRTSYRLAAGRAVPFDDEGAAAGRRRRGDTGAGRSAEVGRRQPSVASARRRAGGGRSRRGRFSLSAFAAGLAIDGRQSARGRLLCSAERRQAAGTRRAWIDRQALRGAGGTDRDPDPGRLSRRLAEGALERRRRKARGARRAHRPLWPGRPQHLGDAPFRPCGVYDSRCGCDGGRGQA